MIYFDTELIYFEVKLISSGNALFSSNSTLCNFIVDVLKGVFLMKSVS